MEMLSLLGYHFIFQIALRVQDHNKIYFMIVYLTKFYVEDW